jgi:hypothetical protein
MLFKNFGMDLRILSKLFLRHLLIGIKVNGQNSVSSYNSLAARFNCRSWSTPSGSVSEVMVTINRSK